MRALEISPEVRKAIMEAYHSVLEDHKRMFGRIGENQPSRDSFPYPISPSSAAKRLEKEQLLTKAKLDWIKEGF